MTSPFDDPPDTHPAFGVIQVNRASVSPPGAVLFDSELRHQRIVTLRISRASRRRALHHDWIHGDGIPLIEVEMSLAQWGALVSSFGTAGEPCTLRYVDGVAQPPLPYEPRLATSTAEVKAATGKLIADIEDAAAALRDAHDTKAGRRIVDDRIRDLEIALANARPNATFTAQSFTEHVENVITKARADIEAMVTMAADHQLDAGTMTTGILTAATDPKEA